MHDAQLRHAVVLFGLTVYLLVYYTLVAGAAITIWRSGLVGHLDPARTTVAFAVAVALGIFLALLSRR